MYILQLFLLWREKTGEKEKMFCLTICPILPLPVEERVPLRNHMEIAATSRIFPNRLEHNCLEELEILVLQKLSFPLVTCLFLEVSAEISNQWSHCRAAPEVTYPVQGLPQLGGRDSMFCKDMLLQWHLCFNLCGSCHNKYKRSS